MRTRIKKGDKGKEKKFVDTGAKIFIVRFFFIIIIALIIFICINSMI
jgi:hypothetical protein